MERRSARAKGRQGEEIAIEYLRGNGYRIVERNFRNLFGEIDIIAREGNTLVFIEVKARNSVSFGSPASAVDSRKQQRITKAALGYMAEKRVTNHPVRFDVVSIWGDEIEVIQDAFELQEGFQW